MCTIAAAFGALSSVSSFAQQSQQTKDYNAAAAQNAVNASLGAQHKYEDEQRRTIYDEKANQKEGYKAALAGRASVATGVASAGGAGIDASSITLSNLIAEEDQKTAENLSRVRLKGDDIADSYKSSVRGYQSEAEGRIASMPFKAGPSPLGLAIGIGSQLATGGTDRGWWGK